MLISHSILLDSAKGSLAPSKEGKSDISVVVDGYITNKQKLCFTYAIDEQKDIGILIAFLYKTYGHEGLFHLDGGFSLVLQDNNKQLSLLYRSFLTGFPLYYVVKNNLLTVSSNPVEFLHQEDVSDTLNIEQMSALFSLNSEAWTDTVFADLNEVAHGEMLMISAEGVKAIRRPLKEVLAKVSYGSESEIFTKYRHLVDAAIAKHILPHKKYGIMLSSGMDSSTLAVLASEQLKKRGEKLHAYSWSLPSYPKADETKKIKALCKALDINLTLVNVEHLDPFSNLDTLALSPDLPLSNLYAAMISQVYAQASKDGIDVLFNGHYGDELFPSTSTLFKDILKDKKYALFLPTLISVIKQTGYRNFSKSPAIRGLIKLCIPFYKSKKSAPKSADWLSTKAKEGMRVVWAKRAKREEGYEVYASALSKINTSSGISRYSTEKYGIERIEPYMDVALLNYTLGLPSYLAYRNGQMKYFAREAMRGLLPESIRTQGRVGILSQFAEESFFKNTQEVKKRLFDEVESWHMYVDEKWMFEKFKDPSSIKGIDILVIWMCLNIGAWQQAIKPGGSLYEGRFMQANSQGFTQ